jgi:hypothetical protein
LLKDKFSYCELSELSELCELCELSALHPLRFFEMAVLFDRLCQIKVRGKRDKSFTFLNAVCAQSGLLSI